MGINLTTVLASAASAHPTRAAIRIDDACLTYAELDALATRVAGALVNASVEPGDRVALMAPNGLHWPVAYHGILRTGAVVVPANPLLRQRELEHCLTDSGASLLIAAAGAAGVARAACAAAGIRPPVTIAAGHDAAELPIGLTAWETRAPDTVQREPGDIAVLLYTSGTTGRPKGAALTHSNLLWNAKVFGESLGVADDVILGALPLFHSFGQSCVMNAGMLGGASIVLVDRFDAVTALRLLDRREVTMLAGVPTMLSGLLAAAPDGEVDLPLRTVVSGGASLPVEVLHAFQARFGCTIYEWYGLSECSPVVTFNTPARPPRPGSVGLPLWGVDVALRAADGASAAVGEVGEVCVRGHCVMRDYWGNPAATAETIDAAGWLRTGDLGRTDEDGYLYIVDRQKDIIIRGGLNVYPREVEEVLYEHPGIAEACVVGIPHATLGEEVAAAVVVHAGATLAPQLVSDWVRERLAPYKYPRHVLLLDALPKGPTGKILKREVVPLISDDLPVTRV
ncbi:MAG: AMP-dependent synthetase [Solirubrobacterales bacterium]|nr:AMP-dependent synthetase [Solirubrobacterales bacterium]